MPSSSSTKAPVIFISHGGPSLLENIDGKAGQFYTWLGDYILNVLQPKAIVVISAHWQAEGENTIFVDTSVKPKLIYDFTNWAPHFYTQTWDHQGSPELAEQVIHLLNKSGINAIGKEYGNDHGVWVPLKRAMKSNLNIPIVEVSTFYHEDLSSHVKIGESLQSLREENILIIASGSAVHNIEGARVWGDKPVPDYVFDFDKELEKYTLELTGQDRIHAAVKLDQHKNYRDCHPTAEHLVPYFAALGAAGNDRSTKLLEFYQARLGWSSYIFGASNDIVLPVYK